MKLLRKWLYSLRQMINLQKKKSFKIFERLKENWYWSDSNYKDLFFNVTSNKTLQNEKSW